MKTAIKTLFLIIISIVFLSCSKTGKEQPIAKKGVLDLRGWDFEKDGSIELKGEWEFYWDKHFQYDDFQSDSPPKLDCYMMVPGSWNEKDIENMEFSTKGYATYKLKIRINQNDINYTIWFKLNDVFPALSIYDSKSEVFTSGIHSQEKEKYMYSVNENSSFSVKHIDVAILN